MHWRNLIQQMSLPPRVLWRKVRNKIKNYLKRITGRFYARRFGTEISDTAFLRSMDNRFSSTQDFLDHLAAQENRRFFLEPDHRSKFAAAILAVCPDAASLTISAADRICDHTFDLLGSGPTHLGDKIDWHIDFKTGHRFDPRRYYTDIRPASYPGGYDIKVPWELSRCQHFVRLGQAYWFTGDEKYAGEFVDQVIDWIEQNPPQFGVNWVCTMDVAIRVVNWLWGYYFFKDSSLLTQEFYLAFFKSLLAHGRHIMNNLEWSEELTSNHYLSNIVGLVYLGILLPEFKEAQQWRELGLQELEKEMFKQVYPDGVNFEASVSYHRLVTELFLSAVLLVQRNGHTFGRPFLNCLEKMLEFTLYVTKPDGTVPFIGDNDNGRIHRLKVWGKQEREWADHRYLLAIGATLFEREDFAQAAGDQWEEAIWFLGEESLAFKRKVAAKGLLPLHLKSRAFVDAGLYILRNDDLYLIVNAGLNGQNGHGGHAHNDTLSFELYTNGQTWIADPGTYIYTADYEARNRFRSTAYHNTVMVDGQEHTDFDPNELFRLPSSLVPRVMEWTADEGIGIVDCEYSADGDWTHRRRVYTSQQIQGAIIDDAISGTGRHTLLASFHVPPSVQVIYISDNKVIYRSVLGTYAVLLQTLNCRGKFLQEKSWSSPFYGQKLQASVVRYQVEGLLPIHLNWVFAFGKTENDALTQGRTLATLPHKKMISAGESGES